MTAGATTNLGLVTADSGDILPEAITKANWTAIDAYVAARSLTNKSGATVAANSVVIVDTTTDSSFTTTVSAGNSKVVGVTQASIVNGAAGIVKQYGVTSVLVTGTTTRGDFLTTSTTAGQALPVTGGTPPAGAFAIALSACTGAGTVTALLITAAVQNAVWAKGADIVSATALQLGSSGAGQYFHVTGTTTITSFSTRTAGEYMILEFDGAVLLTHNASTLILLGAANYTTTAGDMFLFISEGSGNWRQVSGPANQVAPSAFDSIRNSFRTGRKLIGEFTATGGGNYDVTSAILTNIPALGLVVQANATTAAYPTLITEGVEPYTTFNTGGAAAVFFGSGNYNTSTPAMRGVTAPSKNPRMLLRYFPGASSANLTTTLAGFLQGGGTAPAATVNGAYLRCNTTGNLFFVTRQGGTETTTDLGVRPTVLTSYEVETVDAGVTWTCRNSTTGSVVATHTTNVPTAATTLAIGFAGVGGAAVTYLNLAYARFESNFTP